jgi:hypothetical protein
MTGTPPSNDSSQCTDFDAIREHAIHAGGIDPLTLRFRIVQYRESTGEVVGIRADDLGFREAVIKVSGLLRSNSDSHFCLEPVAFLQ